MDGIPTLYYANHTSADFYYLSHFAAPDSYPLLCVPGQRPKLFVNSLEFGRAKKESCCDVVMVERGVSVWYTLLDACMPYDLVGVPYDFPAGLYEMLRSSRGVEILAAGGMGAREIKTGRERQMLEAANDVSKLCFDKIRQILGDSSIGAEDVLSYAGKPLTAEFLHWQVKLVILGSGAFLEGDQIIAPHTQACDPHCSGSGLIRAHQSIVCDIFPRSKSRYFADMTRTFCKGEPPARLREMHDLVLRVQQELIAMAKPGTRLNELGRYAVSQFEEAGFGRTEENGVPCGFIHGLGHGVGLDIHESPNYSDKTPDDVVCTVGQVFSVEPGLYFTSIGGVRIEDCVYVGESGAEIISAYTYDWVID